MTFTEYRIIKVYFLSKATVINFRKYFLLSFHMFFFNFLNYLGITLPKSGKWPHRHRIGAFPSFFMPHLPIINCQFSKLSFYLFNPLWGKTFGFLFLQSSVLFKPFIMKSNNDIIWTKQKYYEP